MIRVCHLTQHYGVRPVLVDLSLEIVTAELVTILGPNGMGKSTLLAAMAGILSPQEGQEGYVGKGFNRPRLAQCLSGRSTQRASLPTWTEVLQPGQWSNSWQHRQNQQPHQDRDRRPILSLIDRNPKRGGGRTLSKVVVHDMQHYR